MRKLNNIKLLILLVAIVISACQSSTQSNEKVVDEPSVFFKNIYNGAVLSSPIQPSYTCQQALFAATHSARTSFASHGTSCC